jgi:large repetitive protein
MSVSFQQLTRFFSALIVTILAIWSVLPAVSVAQSTCTLDSVPGPLVPADQTTTLRLSGCSAQAATFFGFPFTIESSGKFGTSRFVLPYTVAPLPAGSSKTYRAYQCVQGSTAVNEATQFCSPPSGAAEEIAAPYTITWVAPVAPSFTCTLSASPSSVTIGPNASSTLTASCTRNGATTLSRGLPGEAIEYIWTGIGAPTAPTITPSATLSSQSFLTVTSGQRYTVRLRYSTPGITPVESPVAEAFIAVTAPPLPEFSCSLSANPTAVTLGTNATAALNANCTRKGASTLLPGTAGESISYVWTGTGAPPTATSTNTTTLATSAFVNPATAQPYTVKLRYTAPGITPIESPIANATITVLAANAPPSFSCTLAANPTSVTLGTNATATLNANCTRNGASTLLPGTPGESVSYVWSGPGAPTTATGTNTASLTATAFTAAAAAQLYTVKLRYTAPGVAPIESPAAEASITVVAANAPPSFSCTLGANPNSVTLGSSATATLTATCARLGASSLAPGVAGESIAYVWTGVGAPTTATTSPSASLATSAFTTATSGQPYTVKLRYSAPGITAIEAPVATASIAVIAPTSTPVFSCALAANPTSMVIGGSTPATLTASCTVDGFPLRPRLNGAIEYLWTGPGAPASTTDITATIPATAFTNASSGQAYSVKLKYTALGATTSTFSNDATVSIPVRNATDPVFNCSVSASPNSVTLGAATAVTLTASCGRVGSPSLRVGSETIEYVWSGPSAPVSTTDFTATIPASAFASQTAGQQYSVRLKYTAQGSATSVFSNEGTVQVAVNAQPAPILACTLSSDPKEVFLENPRIRLQASCTRDGSPLAVKTGESISYEWLSKDTSIAPTIPAALSPSTTNSISLPESFFLRKGAAPFAVRATISNGSFAGGTITSAEASASVLVVERPSPRDPRKLVCNAAAFPERATRDRATQLSVRCELNVNGVPTAFAANDSLTYQWSADSDTYPQPAPANAAIVNFPAGTFDRINRYSYSVTATLVSPNQNPLPSLKGVTIEIVGGSTERVDVITPEEKRVASPGKLLSLVVRVTNSEGRGVAGKIINWAINPDPSSRPKRRNPIAAVVPCNSEDSPRNSATRATDGNGETTINFTAGCNSGARQLRLSLVGSPDVALTIAVAGPDQAAASLSQLKAPPIIVASPGVKTNVKVFVEDTAREKVPGANVSWEFSPRSAGLVDAQSTSEDDGFAFTNITLNEGVAEARLLVCIVGRASTCTSIIVRNARNAVQEPASTLIKPLVQQSLVAPRLQLLQTRDRMQQLRQEGAGGFYNGLSVTAPGGTAPVSGASGEGGAADGKATGTRDFGMFIVGDLEIYKRIGGAATDRYELRTNGLTFGADYRLRKSLVFGGAISGLRARSGFEDNRTQTATGLSGSLFAQWLPTTNWYVNGTLNAGKNRFKMQRFADDSNLSASTRGNQLAAQIESGYMFDSNGFKITPYARYEFVRATIDPFEEIGGNSAIAIGAQRVRATAFAGGITADYPFSTRRGVLIPSVKLEYVTESQNQSDAFARLVNGTPVLVPVVGEFIDKNYGSFAINLQWLTGFGAQPISSFIGYERTFGKANVKVDRFSAGVKLAL